MWTAAVKNGSRRDNIWGRVLLSLACPMALGLLLYWTLLSPPWVESDGDSGIRWFGEVMLQLAALVPVWRHLCSGTCWPRQDSRVSYPSKNIAASPLARSGFILSEALHDFKLWFLKSKNNLECPFWVAGLALNSLLSCWLLRVLVPIPVDVFLLSKEVHSLDISELGNFSLRIMTLIFIYNRWLL